MPTFARIASAADLPQQGAHESPSLDFKGEVSTNSAGKHDMFEAAKDVAALASVYGGVLLIGACENRGTGELSAWKRMPLVDAQQVVKTYELAVRDRCLPVPVIDVVIVAHPDGDHVVAVNVLPVLHQPVGVKVRGDATDGWGAETYVFPARFSTHAIPLRPDQIAMLMNPEIRRVMILLESIPAAARTKVTFTWHTYTDQHLRPLMGSEMLEIQAIEPLTNSLLLIHRPGPYPSLPFELRIPLDDVETAWEVRPDQWSVRVSGGLDMSNGPAKYTTRPRR